MKACGDIKRENEPRLGPTGNTGISSSFIRRICTSLGQPSCVQSPLLDSSLASTGLHLVDITHTRSTRTVRTARKVCPFDTFPGVVTKIRTAGFSTPFWRNTLLVSLLAVSFYKWAPPRDEDAYLTRWIAHYSTSPDTWARLNEKHMLQSQEVTDNATVQAGATRPGIIRYRYPQ